MSTKYCNNKEETKLKNSDLLFHFDKFNFGIQKNDWVCFLTLFQTLPQTLQPLFFYPFNIFMSYVFITLN